MLEILVVDDDPAVLQYNVRTVRQACEEFYGKKDIDIASATSAGEVFLLVDQKHYDIIFSDINLPHMDGITMAQELEKAVPDTKLIFITENPAFSMAVWNTKAVDFLMKPVSEEQIKLALRKVNWKECIPEPITISCYGKFEIKVKGEPVVFRRGKSREMFAVIVDAGGAEASTEKIRYYLWDEADDTSGKKAYVRALAKDIRDTFQKYGYTNVIQNTIGGYALNAEMVDCDYIKYINGKSIRKKEKYMYGTRIGRLKIDKD